MMSPAQQKTAAAHVVVQRLCSVRRACRYLGIAPTYQYMPKPVPNRREQLYQRIVALSWAYPRYGYRRIRSSLAKEGWTVSRKQVQRIRRREGLNVRPKPKETFRCGLSTGLPRRRISIIFGPRTQLMIGPTTAAPSRRLALIPAVLEKWLHRKFP